MKVNDIWKVIEDTLPETARPVLECFAATGQADLNQIMTHTNLTRDKVNRVLERLESKGVIKTYPRNVKRPDKVGKPAAIYQLTEEGANILKTLGGIPAPSAKRPERRHHRAAPPRHDRAASRRQQGRY